MKRIAVFLFHSVKTIESRSRIKFNKQLISTTLNEIKDEISNTRDSILLNQYTKLFFILIIKEVIQVCFWFRKQKKKLRRTWIVSKKPKLRQKKKRKRKSSQGDETSYTINIDNHITPWSITRFNPFNLLLLNYLACKIIFHRII